jgi:hypothetical protein
MGNKWALCKASLCFMYYYLAPGEGRVLSSSLDGMNVMHRQARLLNSACLSISKCFLWPAVGRHERGWSH